MHSKFTKHGRGSCSKAIDYLLQELDSKGEKRAGIEVLHGDPYAVADVADGLDFKWKYRSSVIAWAPEEVPTKAERLAVLDDYIELAYAGLAPERRCYTAVEHKDHNGGVHIHVIFARVDLETGLSFNPAPPGHRKDFDAFRDYWNYSKGWARPDDPARMKDTQQGHEIHKPAGNRKAITEYIKELAAVGLVTNAADVRAALREIGEITRIGKTRDGIDYIGFKPEGAKSAIRLKGAYYNHDWTRDTQLDREASREAIADTGRGGIVDKSAATAARADYNAAVQRRAEYNQSRYFERPERSLERDITATKDAGSRANTGLERVTTNPDQRAFAEPNFEPTSTGFKRKPDASQKRVEKPTKRSPEPEQDNAKKLAQALVNWRNDCDRGFINYGWRYANIRPLDQQPSTGFERLTEPDYGSAYDVAAVTRYDLGSRFDNDRRPAIHSVAGGSEGRTGLDGSKPSSFENGVVEHDRDRAITERAVTGAGETEKPRDGGITGLAERTSAAIRVFATVCFNYVGTVRDYVHGYYERRSSLQVGSGSSGSDSELERSQDRKSVNGLDHAIEQLKQQCRQVDRSCQKLDAVAVNIEQQRAQQRQRSRGGWEMGM